MRAQSLLTRRTQGLDDGERLLLEEHLARCARCAADAALLDRMRESVHDAGEELPLSARRRALKRAMAAARTAPAPAQNPMRRRMTLALAAAAVVLGGLLTVRLAGAPELTTAGTGLANAIDTQALAAALEQHRPRPASAPSRIDAPPGTRLELAGARIEALEASALKWTAERDTVELTSGAIHVELPTRAGRRFRVATARFVVEVVGTSFDVDEQGVAVRRGRVRVLEVDSERQLSELGAGDTWTVRPTSANTLADVDARIAQARRELAAGRPAKARALLTRALAERLTRRQSAEARSLLAECALVEGNHAEAARVYGEVASSNKDSLAGESALFGQARAHMRAGNESAARQTFQRYLERYPDGRFTKEAREHLRQLGKGR
jgi:ferric-dicitrate binding protein FerR (iron transport regulator)